MMPIMSEGTNHENQRKKMIEEALKTKAPRMYQELKTSQKLPQFLTEQESLMMDAFRGERTRLMGPEANIRPNENPIEQVQRIEMSLKAAWEETLETFLDFSDQ